MAIDAKHPSYERCIADWLMLRDINAGERTIKDKGTDYLPPSGGMIEDGQGKANTKGDKAYQAYKLRAIFHDFFADTVRRAVGILHRKPAVIELPKALEFLIDTATPIGEPAEMLLRRINREQLITGRVGLFADMPAAELKSDQTVYIATYAAETAINWMDGTTIPGQPASLGLVVLDETGDVMDPDTFQWRQKSQFRTLKIVDGVYSVGVFSEGENFNDSELTIPQLKGQTFDKIPFIFVNPNDIASQADVPPLLGLAHLCLAIYRGEADYRQSLFLQGQDTLVTIGSLVNNDPVPDDAKPVRTGAGARISMVMGGDAKYIGVDSQGLPEQRQSIQNDKHLADERSIQLLESKSAESGAALKIRREGRTATLTDIAKTGAAGLEAMFKLIAEWHGADPEQVMVTPNLDFTDDPFTGTEAKAWMEAKGIGLPLAQESLHDYMRRREVTNRSFEDEMDLISQEEFVPPGTDEGGNFEEGSNGEE